MNVSVLRVVSLKVNKIGNVSVGISSSRILVLKKTGQKNWEKIVPVYFFPYFYLLSFFLGRHHAFLEQCNFELKSKEKNTAKATSQSRTMGNSGRQDTH